MNYSKLLVYRQGVLYPQTKKAESELKNNKVSFYYLEKERIELLRFANLIKKSVNVLMDPIEICQLAMLVKNTRKIKGDIAEVGVYQGGSARVICKYKGKKHLYLIDTFEGLPRTKRSDRNKVINKIYKKGQYPSTMEMVKKSLSSFDDVYIYKDFFSADYRTLNGKKFSLVHLDLDIFQSTLDCLTYFYPRMCKGGVIITHDYQSASGVKRAFDQFFKNKSEIIIELAVTQAMVVVV